MSNVVRNFARKSAKPLQILVFCCPPPHHICFSSSDEILRAAARNFDHEGPLDDVYAFNAQIFAKDRAIVESQTPEELPLGLASEAHFPADKSSTTYRHPLSGMRSGRRFTT